MFLKVLCFKQNKHFISDYMRNFFPQCSSNFSLFQIEWLVLDKFSLDYVLMMEPARHTIHPTRRTQKPLLMYRSDNCLESHSTHLDLEKSLNLFETKCI